VKASSCFETKKVAKPVHAVTGTLGKMERLPSMDKDVAGATLELRPARTCLWTTATISIGILTATISIGILTATISIEIPIAIISTGIPTAIPTATDNFTATTISMDNAIIMA